MPVVGNKERFAAHFIYYHNGIKSAADKLMNSEVLSAPFKEFLLNIKSLADQFNNAQNTAELRDLFRLCKSMLTVIEKATHPNPLQQQKVERHMRAVKENGDKVNANWGDLVVGFLNEVLPHLTPAPAVTPTPAPSGLNFSGTFFGVKAQQPKDPGNNASELPLVLVND